MKEIHKAKMTANMAMVTDGKGYPTTSTIITTTELNMLNNIRTNVQTQLDNLDDKSMLPDYTAKISVSTNTYTAPSNGYLVVNGGYEHHLNITVNDVQYHTGSAGSRGYESATVPLAKSDVVTVGSYSSMYFVPCK